MIPGWTQGDLGAQSGCLGSEHVAKQDGLNFSIILHENVSEEAGRCSRIGTRPDPRAIDGGSAECSTCNANVPNSGKSRALNPVDACNQSLRFNTRQSITDRKLP